MPSPREEVLEPFEFEDAGRTFMCSGEPLRDSSPETWWWFRVSTEANTRYAAFRTERGDKRGPVQARVVAYWDDLLARRAAPPVNRWKRGPQPPVDGQAAAPAAVAVDPAPAMAPDPSAS